MEIKTVYIRESDVRKVQRLLKTRKARKANGYQAYEIGNLCGMGWYQAHETLEWMFQQGMVIKVTERNAEHITKYL